jgi:hypothetical protein
MIRVTTLGAALGRDGVELQQSTCLLPMGASVPAAGDATHMGTHPSRLQVSDPPRRGALSQALQTLMRFTMLFASCDGAVSSDKRQ